MHMAYRKHAGVTEWGPKPKTAPTLNEVISRPHQCLRFALGNDHSLGPLLVPIPYVILFKVSRFMGYDQ